MTLLLRLRSALGILEDDFEENNKGVDEFSSNERQRGSVIFVDVAES